MRIGIPKEEKLNLWIRQILSEAGISMSFPNRVYRYTKGDYTFHLRRGRDIPKLVDLGMLDAGFTGTDHLNEHTFSGRRPAPRLRTIKFEKRARWSISLIGKPGTNPSHYPTIVSEYPQFTRARFPTHEVIEVHGCIEDFVPDIVALAVTAVETGETLRIHELVVVEHLLMGCPCLIYNTNFLSNVNPLVDSFLELIKEC